MVQAGGTGWAPTARPRQARMRAQGSVGQPARTSQAVAGGPALSIHRPGGHCFTTGQGELRRCTCVHRPTRARHGPPGWCLAACWLHKQEPMLQGLPLSNCAALLPCIATAVHALLVVSGSWSVRTLETGWSGGPHSGHHRRQVGNRQRQGLGRSAMGVGASSSQAQLTTAESMRGSVL